MSDRKKLLLDLDSVLKTAAAKKTAAIKRASIGDNEEDGTRAVETGAQMASNKAESAKGTAAMIDGGAKANPAGASLEMSTDGATAVKTDGSAGAEGADLEVKHDAANGPEGGIKGDDKTASTKNLVASLRKSAASLNVPAKTEAAKPVQKTAAANTLEKLFAKKATAEVSPLEKFLIERVCASNEKIAQEVGADPAAGGQVVEQILAGIQSGAISEEDAQKILMEAAQSGAISEQDIQEALAALQGAGGQGGAPAGDPAAMGGAPAGDPAAAGGMPPADPAMGGGEMVEDPSLEAKMAAADVGPDHQDYLAKLASLYPKELQAGYDLAVKLAEASIGDNVEDGTKSTPEGESIAGNPEMKPAAPVKGKAVGTEGQQDNNANNDIPADKKTAQVAKKAGHEGGMPGDPAAGGMPPADPAMGGGQPAPGPEAAGAMGGDAAVMNPQSPEEQAALMQVLAEMGITPEQLKQLLSQQGAPAPAGDPASPEAKIASYKLKARVAILTKAAQLAETTKKA